MAIGPVQLLVLGFKQTDFQGEIRKELLYTTGRGLTGWDWFRVVIAALLDIGHWAAGATQRNQLPGRRTAA